MRGNRLSIRLLGSLATFGLALLVTATAASQEKVLHSFGNGTDGESPYGSLIMDAAGNLYGTTYWGGIRGSGMVFELTPNESGGWTEKVLHSFGNRADGAGPTGGLIFDAAGNLYGTTENGGIHLCNGVNCGTVFELSPNGSGGWTEKVLHSFGGGDDGSAPYAGVVFDTAGNLYGTTIIGGTAALGTVFELRPNDSGGWTERVLHNFGNHPNDGYYPFSGLVFDGAGNLYGTTEQGGIHSCGVTTCGTVFGLTPNGSGGWTETVLHNFGRGSDGNLPEAGLTIDAAGNLYGTTYSGGIYTEGTVFELSPRVGGGWTETVLRSFWFQSGDGAYPVAGLILDTAGNLYGTTRDSGIHGDGTAFEMSPKQGGGWIETVLHSFNENGRDGYSPYAGLMMDAAGNLYGTTNAGGIHGWGTVFEITPSLTWDQK